MHITNNEKQLTLIESWGAWRTIMGNNMDRLAIAEFFWKIFLLPTFIANYGHLSRRWDGFFIGIIIVRYVVWFLREKVHFYGFTQKDLGTVWSVHGGTRGVVPGEPSVKSRHTPPNLLDLRTAGGRVFFGRDMYLNGAHGRIMYHHHPSEILLYLAEQIIIK